MSPPPEVASTSGSVAAREVTAFRRAQTQEGFVLGFIVGDLPEDLQDVFELFARWRDQEYPCACALEVE
jgi:hypothetical protein